MGLAAMQSSAFFLSFRQLWLHMGLGRRRQGAISVFTDPGRDLIRAKALQLLVEKVKAREKSIAHWTPERKAGLLAPLTVSDEDLADGLIKSYYLSTQTKMMGRFLDLLQVPHQYGSIEVELQPLPQPALKSASEVLHHEFDSFEVDLYLNALYLSDQVVWAGLRPEEEEPVRQMADETDSESDEFESHKTRPQGLQPPRFSKVSGKAADGLTVLDDMVTLQIIQWATKIEGTLGDEEIDNLVEELIHQNGTRQRSYYHRGFLDVLKGTTPQPVGCSRMKRI
jgi:hypothetical protein